MVSWVQPVSEGSNKGLLNAKQWWSLYLNQTEKNVLTKIRLKMFDTDARFLNPVFWRCLRQTCKRSSDNFETLRYKKLHRCRCLSKFLVFVHERISRNKDTFLNLVETFIMYVSALASRKGGWCGIRLAFWRDLPTLKPCFSLPFPSETTDTSGKGCFFSSLQRPCESSDFA